MVSPVRVVLLSVCAVGEEVLYFVFKSLFRILGQVYLQICTRTALKKNVVDSVADVDLDSMCCAMDILLRLTTS